MDMTEKQLSSEYKFKGRIMTARVDEVSLPNGKTAPREVCEHVGGVGVLPIDKDGNVILVRQFRYAFDTEAKCSRMRTNLSRSCDCRSQR